MVKQGRRIKLTVQYDGTAYIGWQRQPLQHGLSLQQVLEDVLKLVIGKPVTVHSAGRTDKGVHALGQVVHFDCPTVIPVAGLQKALNHRLPPDMRIVAAEGVADDFHARYAARGKCYRYLLAADTPTPYNWRWYWPQQRLPDAERMSEAAQYLLGEHDFRHFTLSNATVKNFVRTMQSIRIYVPQQSDLPCYLAQPLAIEAEANGFLYKMVRLIVCRLVAVGQGRLQPQAMRQFLTGEEMLRLAPAPPQGLMLMRVYYDEFC